MSVGLAPCSHPAAEGLLLVPATPKALEVTGPRGRQPCCEAPLDPGLCEHSCCYTHTHTTPPPGSPRSTERRLCPLAGYSGPLREVPPEKFNVTAIPKGYRSPWHRLLGDKDKAVGRENQLPMKPSYGEFVSFNR